MGARPLRETIARLLIPPFGVPRMPRNPDTILNESFLDVRAKLLEVAATLDRIDRAGNNGESLSADLAERRAKIDQAIQICGSPDADRADRLHTLFSRSYDPQWRTQMNL